MEMQTYKDSIEDLEEHEVSPEERKILQQSYNKFNKFNKFKIRPRFPSRTQCHSDDADYYQMQGDKCWPAALCKYFKKWNAECGDKPSKPIAFLPLPIETTRIKYLPTNENVLLPSVKYRVANIKVELIIIKVCEKSDEGDLVLQQFLVEIKDEDKEDIFTE